MMDKVSTVSGLHVYFDPEMFMAAYGAHAARVTVDGEIQVLIVTTDGAEWLSLEEADLVQPVGKPAKVRKQ